LGRDGGAAMANLPDFPVHGGCACGAVRYRLIRAPYAVYTCHCTDCQTLTASVFSLNGVVQAEDLEIVSGELTMWLRTAESGARIPQHVCGHCGVRIFTEPPDGSGTQTLRLGTLDDTSWLVPSAAIFMKSAQLWVRMPEGTLLYDQGPADFMPIIAKWREMMGLG